MAGRHHRKRPWQPPRGPRRRSVPSHPSPSTSSLDPVLFAGNDAREPVVLDIWGGTNVHWSLSHEYLDQFLAPALE
ncbi:hypothetical protein J3458_021077 [Metarhizium acridum]|uniref:uncharacterized protein n=1 Tax=Metarhizium acridum TaxID=92637 RepID=UPI001C6C1923|nr:hypothetical protein J3458_021077 [Metarhizium acridum]